MVEKNRILIITGPNGAGKTTFAREFLPNEGACPMFVNADLIAAGLSPFNPDAAAIRAGRLMLAEIDAHVRRGESFAFETTLSGRGYLRRIAAWRRQGYRVELVFLSLPSAEMAVRRVAQRVAQGGHDIPVHVIRRRFAAGRSNFDRLFKSAVDAWFEYDCSGKYPTMVARSRADVSQLRTEDIEAALRRAAQRTRHVAAQTGTPLVIMKDGQVFEIPVTPTIRR